MSDYQDDDPDVIHFSDSSDNPFDTPSIAAAKRKARLTREDDEITYDLPDDPAPAPASRQQPAERLTSEEAAEARDAALRAELANIRKINQVVSDVVASLEKAKTNMDTVSRTVTSASTLLQTWTRILSQTEHNQRLILNPAWNGATQDIADLESEALQRERDARRRQAEDQARREAALRQAEEEERRRAEAASRASAGSRGRGKGRGSRGGSVGGAGAGDLTQMDVFLHKKQG
ncbi:hypothetical protein EJ06DRAFT_523122 [Trichodelitschia bisporula]|uniref:DASH complex subunit DUO1 n=1 Tax=Trichodelitschia bisporula TaxID=703511 RepID=A0A6G1HQD5_9PEZI|nr:hypothetical protein EJ06DRAFT_523122 [Trichodelitschia bisporula]